MEGTFSLEVAEFVRKAKLNTDTVLRKVGADALRSVVQKSPVDTGRFKANWVVSYEPGDITGFGVDREGLATLNKGFRVIQLWVPERDELWISNSLPYARRLEYGYSGQAPRGMVRITVMEFKSFIDRAIRSL